MSNNQPSEISVGPIDLSGIKPIFQVFHYERDGVYLQELTSVEGSRVNPNRRFKAIGHLQIQTPQGIVPHAIEFYVEATGIRDAFDRFPEAFEKAAQREIARLKVQVR